MDGNCILQGEAFRQPQGKESASLAEFNRRLASDPPLVSLALSMDDDFTDGFAMAGFFSLLSALFWNGYSK